ncbi:hypothetical protein ABT403_13360 [Streptomyces sp. NPDC000075]
MAAIAAVRALLSYFLTRKIAEEGPRPAKPATHTVGSRPSPTATPPWTGA